MGNGTAKYMTPNILKRNRGKRTRLIRQSAVQPVIVGLKVIGVIVHFAGLKRGVRYG
jgi:hypothetical protein